VRRPAALLALISVLLLWSPTAASAHPLGNFTVNRYAGVVVSRDRVLIDYVLDLAEIPTFQERSSIDLDGDGVEEAELRAWSAGRAAVIVEGLVLRVDHRPIDLAIGEVAASMPPGQGGLSTLRLEVTYSAPIESRSGDLTFEDRNEPERLGWREITATGVDGVALVSPSVPGSSVSDRLRSYPQDLLSSPLSVTTMEATFRPGSSVGTDPTTTTGTSRPRSDGGALASLIGREGLPLMALGLLVAVGFGAWHALLPGHGKTLVAAAIVGSSAKRRQAITAGVAVALMHTASVVSLGLLVLGLERAFRPEAVYPWLGVTSGAAAVGIGIHLLRGRWRSWRGLRDRAHIHAFAPGERVEAHEHPHDGAVEGFLSRRGIAALAFAGGILPAPSALIVLLAAIQGQRTAYGLALVLSFSLGLAAALILVGLGAMRARTEMHTRLSERIGRLVPVVAAAAIVLVGTYVMTRSALAL
jgi:nickel/cobalt exporter